MLKGHLASVRKVFAKYAFVFSVIGIGNYELTIRQLQLGSSLSIVDREYEDH